MLILKVLHRARIFVKLNFSYKSTHVSEKVKQIKHLFNPMVQTLFKTKKSCPNKFFQNMCPHQWRHIHKRIQEYNNMLRNKKFANTFQTSFKQIMFHTCSETGNPTSTLNPKQLQTQTNTCFKTFLNDKFIFLTPTHTLENAFNTYQSVF